MATPAWQRKEGKSKSGGLNKKGVASYRAANPGSKLKTAVTTKPSKLKKGSKASKRRKSFCARMEGMKKRRTSAKTARDPNSRINKSLRKWNCQYIDQLMRDETAIYIILKKIRARKEELKEIIAAGLPGWDEYNKTVGEFKAYAIMEQEIQDLQKDEDNDDRKGTAKAQICA